MSRTRAVALVLLALGSLLALAGLALVLNNSSNTPPVFILMIVGGVTLGFVGLVTLPFSRGRVQATEAEGQPAQAPHRSAAPALSALGIVLTTVFLIAVGLVVGFFYLIHRWFGDWNLW